VIFGNENHPEVQGIRGWVQENVPVTILSSREDVEKFYLKPGEKACIVSQTTFNYKKFQELVEIISKRGYNISVLNTICNATEERQKEALEIARQSEAMIVIGDKKSSNTQKLFEICKNQCENTYYLQTKQDLDYQLLKGVNSIGITAGASTPNKIIEEVSKNVRDEL
jgi:4-hydroxy-3-methylbut-2-enyl diphosphate reductase